MFDWVLNTLLYYAEETSIQFTRIQTIYFLKKKKRFSFPFFYPSIFDLTFLLTLARQKREYDAK